MFSVWLIVCRSYCLTHLSFCQQKFKLKIEDPPRRKNLVFLGASVLGNIMENRPDFWVTQEEYKEQGAAIAAKRFSRG